jgi:alcohol-forming fatty acyl-CoA reductase
VIAPGDLMLPGLGLEPAMADTIRASASVVLHCAATVNFNEKLKVALKLNVLSVQQLLAFARSFMDLAAFVHVSTAFSNCDRLCIQETVYDPVVDPKALMNAVFSMDDATAERITPGLVGARPNTYTFTKSLAEAILREDGKGMPVAIMRPSIIGAALRGSLPGWQDNLNGPGGLYIAAAHGVLRVMKGDPWAICDIVPVDYCANITLAIAWHLGTTPRDQLPAELPVFHCTCGSTNQMSWGAHFDVCFDALRAFPLAEERRPFVTAAFNFEMNPTRLAIQTFAKHTLPAMAVDAGLVLSGQKPMMRRLYGKLNSAIQAYEFFTSRSWWWEHNNAPELARLLSPADREAFNFDMTRIDWFAYICDYWSYTQTFIRPDPPEKRALDAQRYAHMRREAAKGMVV